MKTNQVNGLQDTIWKSFSIAMRSKIIYYYLLFVYYYHDIPWNMKSKQDVVSAFSEATALKFSN